MFTQRKFKPFNPFGVEIGKITESDEDKQFWRQFGSRGRRILRKQHLHLRYNARKRGELAFALSLLITLTFFLAIRSANVATPNLMADQIILVEVEEIPMTKQEQRTPPPARPQVAIPSDDLDIPEEETIEATDLVFSEIPPPPAPPEDGLDASSDVFVAFDTPPQPIGGWKKLYQHLIYPINARKAGVEGRVLVNVLVDEKGKIVDMKILKGTKTGAGLEESAMNAIHQLAFRPALQRDKPVKVWITVPVTFSLISDPS